MAERISNKADTLSVQPEDFRASIADALSGVTVNG